MSMPPAASVDSPSARKRKLPSAPSPAPGASSSTPAKPTESRPTPAQQLNLNMNYSRLSKVPLAGSGTTIPPLTSPQLQDMQKWIQTDKEYERTFNAMRERTQRELGQAIRAKIGWWEEPLKGPKTERFNVLWPDRKRAERIKKLKRAGIRWEGIRL